MNATRLVTVVVITCVDFPVTAPAPAAPVAKAPVKPLSLTLVNSSGTRSNHKFRKPSLAVIDAILGGHAVVMTTNSGEAMFFVERPAEVAANVFASVEGNRVIRGPVLICSVEDANRILGSK